MAEIICFACGQATPFDGTLCPCCEDGDPEAACLCGPRDDAIVYRCCGRYVCRCGRYEEPNG